MLILSFVFLASFNFPDTCNHSFGGDSSCLQCARLLEKIAKCGNIKQQDVLSCSVVEACRPALALTYVLVQHSKKIFLASI